MNINSQRTVRRFKSLSFGMNDAAQALVILCGLAFRNMTRRIFFLHPMTRQLAVGLGMPQQILKELTGSCLDLEP